MPRMHKAASTLTLEPGGLRENPGPTISSLDMTSSESSDLLLFPYLPNEVIIILISCTLKVVGGLHE